MPTTSICIVRTVCKFSVVLSVVCLCACVCLYNRDCLLVEWQDS